MNTQNFDWGLVRSFLAALEHGSLLGAARALGTSQPTLGRHIAELEAQLGVLLFERTGRGLQPTATALRLAESARATGVIEQVEGWLAEVEPVHGVHDRPPAGMTNRFWQLATRCSHSTFAASGTRMAPRARHHTRSSGTWNIGSL